MATANQKNVVKAITPEIWNAYQGLEGWDAETDPIYIDGPANADLGIDGPANVNLGDEPRIFADSNGVYMVDPAGNEIMIPGLIFPNQTSAMVFLAGFDFSLISQMGWVLR